MNTKFNINYYVKVKLTELGHKELERQHEELRESFPKLDKYKPLPVDDDGYTKFQLWSLMQDLGHLCRLGGNPPFETEIIFINPQG